MSPVAKYSSAHHYSIWASHPEQCTRGKLIEGGLSLEEATEKLKDLKERSWRTAWWYKIRSGFDSDLESMDHSQLLAECLKLRAAIREHRDSSGHNLCWYQPELWNLLPDKHEPRPSVPPRPEFLARCAEYRDSLPDGLAQSTKEGPERTKALEEGFRATLKRLEEYTEILMHEDLFADEEAWQEDHSFIENMRALLKGT